GAARADNPPIVLFSNLTDGAPHVITTLSDVAMIPHTGAGGIDWCAPTTSFGAPVKPNVDVTVTRISARIFVHDSGPANGPATIFISDVTQQPATLVSAETGWTAVLDPDQSTVEANIPPTTLLAGHDYSIGVAPASWFDCSFGPMDVDFDFSTQPAPPFP